MEPTNILHLPDEILLHILKHVDIEDLKSLKSCCRRLKEVAEDSTLWNVDLRENPTTKHKLSYVRTHILDESITKLAIRGDFSTGKRENSLSLKFIRAVHHTCRQLKQLIIEDYYINRAELFVNYFPSTIEKVSLKGCVLVPALPPDEYSRLENGKTYKVCFSTIHSTNPNLNCLILTGICWPLSDILENISRLNHLTELRLNNCSRILSFDLNGVEFNTLEILDLRNTPVQHKQLEMFCRAQTLKRLFLKLPKYLRELSNTSVEALRRSLDYRESLLSSLQYRVQFYIEDIRLSLHCRFMELYLADDHHERAREERIKEFKKYRLQFTKLLLSDSFRNLERLHVTYYPFNSTDMNNLISKAPKLKYLNIKGTAVTIEDVQYFHSQRPDVNIFSSFGTWRSTS